MRNTTISGSGSGVYRLGRSGKLEEMKPAPVLPVGCRVVGFGFAGALQYFAVIDNARHIVEIPHEYPEHDEDICTENYFSPRHQLDEFTRPIEDKFGIGFYYDLSAPRYSAEEIARAIAHAERVERVEKERAEEAARASARITEELKRKYHYLTRNPQSAREITGNLRKELNLNFPGVKFSVRYSSFSGGDEITVKYFDGVPVEKVNAIANKYQNSHSDWSDDYMDYDPSEFNRLFGGAKFVMVKREISEAVEAALIADIIAVCPFLANGVEMRTEDFFDGLYKCDAPQEKKNQYAEAVRGGWWVSARSLARWVHHNIDYTQSQTPEQPQTEVNDERAAETVADDNGLQLVDYSEKAFVITGDTRDKKDLLKALGGRFNPRLNCGAGWVFSKLRINEVRQRLGL